VTEAIVPPDVDQEMPDDVADAWATVLLDIYEKRKHPMPVADDHESDDNRDEPAEDA